MSSDTIQQTSTQLTTSARQDQRNKVLLCEQYVCVMEKEFYQYAICNIQYAKEDQTKFAILQYLVYNEMSKFRFSYGHTTQKAPDPVRSPKLSCVWQSQYCGGGPHGNTLCCNFFYFSKVYKQVSLKDRGFFLVSIERWSLKLQSGPI